MFNEVPILMYHHVEPNSADRNTVTVDKFAWQMDYLLSHGYHTIKLTELSGHLMQHTPLPSKSVLITFDDGYRDNYDYALPLLKQYGMTAIVFVVAGWVGRECGWRKKNQQQSRLMSWDQLREWHACGLEIGSHTVHHPKLSLLSDQQMKEELVQSKLILEKNLAIPIDYLCYPYGDFDEQVQTAAQKAGYQAALAIANGTSIFTNDRYALRRVGISSRLGKGEFKLKVSPIHPLFIALKNMESFLKKCRKSK